MTEHATEQNATVRTEADAIREEGLIVNGLYSIHGLVTIAINANTLRPITSAADNTSYEPNDKTSLLAAPGDDEWVLRMTRLRTSLLTDLSNERAERDRLQTHLAGLGEALRDEAIRREWCEEYDTFADQWGLPPRALEYDVTMTVRVRAADEDTARELVSEEVNISRYGYQSHDWVVESPDYSVSEA